MKCNQCQSSFEITPEERHLYDKFGHEPTGMCFECDQKNRLCFRNERSIYNRKCDATGEKIVSIYSPDKPYKVYKSEYWYGDQWDELEYGQEMDFSRPFFEQLKELQLKVPRPPLVNLHGENSDYCNMCVYNKNCYLVFGGDYNEDVQYGTLCMHNRNSLDLDFSNKNELCYMLGDTIGSYGCQFAFDSKNCKECAFISDCSSCTECILCTNLSNKTYCIENKELGKEEYLKKKEELLNGSYKTQQTLLQRFLTLHQNRIVKFAHMLNCENCSGDYIKNSKNCHNCYDTADSEDIRNVIVAYEAKDLFNSSLIGHGSQLCYNTLSSIDVTDGMFSYFTMDSSGVRYCDIAINSHDCFGCVGINRKRNCILNKQYNREDYENLKTKIIEHMKKTPYSSKGSGSSQSSEWGQFLPKNMSCFSYPETTAHDYYPMKKEEAVRQGFNWMDVLEHKPEADKIVHADELPDNIADVPDDIVNWAIECEKSKRLFKITPQELKFYRNNHIPIPHLHSEERHDFRKTFRNPKKLYSRECMKCGTPIQTTYAPDRLEKVYCEPCYLKEVY